MLLGLFFCLALFILYFSYEQYPSEFSATASAIRSVWSGGCRLSCQRDHERSLGIASIYPSFHEPDGNCVCESCPCNLVDNVLRRCRPASQLYEQFINSLSIFLGSIFDKVFCMLEAVRNIYHCRYFCHQAETVRRISVAELREISDNRPRESVSHSRVIESAARVPFSAATRVVVPPTERKLTLLRDGFKFSIDNTKADIKRQIENISRQNIKPPTETSRVNTGTQHTEHASLGVSSATLTADPPPCTKCFEQGVTCVPECPRRNKKKKS